GTGDGTKQQVPPLGPRPLGRDDNPGEVGERKMSECLGHGTSAAQKRKRIPSPRDSTPSLTPPTVETVGYRISRPGRSSFALHPVRRVPIGTGDGTKQQVPPLGPRSSVGMTIQEE